MLQVFLALLETELNLVIHLQLITALQKIDVRNNKPQNHRLHLILSLVLTGRDLFCFAQLVMSVNGL
jgi:hypothetical protein